MADTQLLKLALVGCGNIANAHWRGIQTHVPELAVTAVVDSDAERAAAMAAQTGAQPFLTLEDALAQGDFDAVDIMLPHHLHEEAAVAAFAAGKHVVLEKPMAPTLAACDRIMAAARRAGTVFMVAEQAQYWPDALHIRQLIHEGAIGEILLVRAFFGGPDRSDPTLDGPKPWRYLLAMAGGGLCIDGVAHWIRPMRMWLGEIDEVIGVVGHPLAAMEGESLAQCLLRFQSGVTVTFEALHAGAVMAPGEEFRITGTLGEIIVERGWEGRVLLTDEAHPGGRELMYKGEGRRAAFGYELQDFARAVLTGSSLAAAPEYSLGELRTALAIYRSVESRRWEKVWA